MTVQTPSRQQARRPRSPRSEERSSNGPKADPRKNWQEKRLVAQYEVVCGLAESARVDEAAKRILQQTCACLDWVCGAFWKVDAAAGVMRCIATWATRQGPPNDFVRASRRVSFHRGHGCPGRIWQSGEHLWVPEMDRLVGCPRSQAACRASLNATFGFPVRIQGEVLAVMEFFSETITKPDDCLLNLMTTIAGQMAQFMMRVEVEEQRRATEERLQAVLNHTTSVIYIKDLRGKYLLVNRQFENLFHVDRKDAVGQTDFDIFPEDAASGFARNDQTVLQLGQPVEFEEIAPHDDGPHTYISVKCPLRNAHAVTYGVCGISTDITARKQSEEELLKANAQLVEKNLEFARSETALREALDQLQQSHQELKAAQQELLEAARLKTAGQLAAGVAHEVKNPLQTILMGLAYLARNLRDPHGLSGSVLTDMKDAVARADIIVRDLLTLSSSRPLELAEEDLHALVEECLRLVMFELNRAHIDVVREFADGLPQLQLDKARIQEMFINLFMNAIQAMPDGGRLIVRSRLESREAQRGSHRRGEDAATPIRSVVVVEIQDSGVGIPPDKLPRIFEPFFTTKPTGKGTGLGLPICKQIMDAHGGEIDISQVQPTGVRVRVTLRP